MSRDPSVPSLQSLQQPQQLSKALAEDKSQIDDCTPCRVTGAAAFIGLGAYSYFSGQTQLERQQAEIIKSGSRFGMRSRKMGVTGIAVTLVGLGVYRLVA